MSGEDGEKKEGKRDNLFLRVSRYERAKRKTLKMSSYLSTVDGRLSRQLAGCASYLVFRNYHTVGKLKLTKANFCKTHLLCVFCAIRRGAKYLQAYADRYRVIRESHPGLCMELVTFTVKNGDDLGERFRHLSDSLQKLRDRKYDSRRGRSSSEWGKVRGAVGAFEITNRGRGWHPHAHDIVLSDHGIGQEPLRDEWKEITGDSFEIDVRPLDKHEDPEKDFSEVFKYAISLGDLSEDRNYEAYEVLKGRKLVFSQGLFRGVKVPDSLTDAALQGLAYQEILYRWYNSGGYSVERFKQFDACENKGGQDGLEKKIWEEKRGQA